MHTLIISEVFPPDMGGSATRAYNVMKGLLANAVNVTVITGFPHYPTGNVPKEYRNRAIIFENNKKTRIFRTFVPPLASKGFARRLFLFASFTITSIFPIVSVRKINGVFASHPQIISAFPALLYKMIFHCPLILNVDDLWPESLFDLGMMPSKIQKKIGELIAKLAYSAADIIVPISPAYIETIVNKYGIRRNKVLVVPGGVDLELFSAEHKDSSQNEVFKVLYIGAFSPAYDFIQVLKAAKLLDREDKIKIILQGGGELAQTIRKKIEELCLSKTELIEKIVSREEAARIMMDSDALLLPLSGLENIEKGISSKLYEYQGARKPIICCSRGESGKYVLKTNSGIVIEPGQCENLAKAIVLLRDNKNLARQLGASGRKHVEENLSVYKIGMRMKRIFETLEFIYTKKAERDNINVKMFA